eukprot:702194-Rhodomonas_salina.1
MGLVQQVRSTPKSNTSNRIFSTICTRNAVSCFLSLPCMRLRIGCVLSGTGLAWCGAELASGGTELAYGGTELAYRGTERTHGGTELAYDGTERTYGGGQCEDAASLVALMQSLCHVLVPVFQPLHPYCAASATY